MSAELLIELFNELRLILVVLDVSFGAIYRAQNGASPIFVCSICEETPFLDWHNWLGLDYRFWLDNFRFKVVSYEELGVGLFISINDIHIRSLSISFDTVILVRVRRLN